MGSRNYQDLIVWQKGMDLVDAIYDLTDSFPQKEVFGLSSQMRRSAVSIVSNIAEGSKRGSQKDFRNFLLMAYGSCAELETQLLLAQRRNFGKVSDGSSAQSLIQEVSKMLHTLSQNFSPKHDH